MASHKRGHLDTRKRQIGMQVAATSEIEGIRRTVTSADVAPGMKIVERVSLDIMWCCAGRGCLHAVGMLSSGDGACSLFPPLTTLSNTALTKHLEDADSRSRSRTVRRIPWVLNMIVIFGGWQLLQHKTLPPLKDHPRIYKLVRSPSSTQQIPVLDLKPRAGKCGFSALAPIMCFILGACGGSCSSPAYKS